MAATGSSSASATQYDVFLSFRGPDTRDTFTDCLYRTMAGQGIVAYRDNEELHAGDRINDLLTAVGNSKICIPVLSRGYASSAWCLRELARATELNESTRKPAILPIFFDVTPDDVKLKTELYKEDLKELEGRHGLEMRQRWEAALEKVGKIKGWEAQEKPHGEVIELVVKEVQRKLKVKERLLDNKLVGVDEQVEAIMELLDIDSGTGVRFVGIYGMGGIGKTTLAKIVFNKLCPCFDSQCSFIENIRASSKGNGLVDLQRRLASDISDSRFVENFSNTDEGIDSITRRAVSKKVLVVLDDLDNTEQLKKLVGRPDTFGSGSRIIITTRDKQILDEKEEILPYEVKQLDFNKALELFTLHAFKSVSPTNTQERLSWEIVSTTGGLPLALEVIGSYLHCQNEKIWQETLQRLKNVPHDDVRDKLKISYDALRVEKEIFLDIACFFINEEKSWAIYFWDACNLYPHSSLKRLIDLCLIKIVRGDVLWMHDQLRDLGRDIICQESVNLTGRSRLWNGEEALKVVMLRKGKDKVQALNLVEHSSDLISIGNEQLEEMPNLKFLKLKAGTFAGDVNNYLLELRWLSWDSPPLDRRMTNLHLENLVVFKLSDNNNNENWGGWNILKMANKLKVLSLSKCEGLKRTPDFSECLSLERLALYNCPNLQEVDSIGKLKGLTHLDIFWCTILRTLPEEIGGLVKLEHFFVRECPKIEKLPYSIGNAKQLSFLNLYGTLIVELPISIGELTQLKFLSLKQCKNLGELPESVCNVRSLQELDLSWTKIVELPDSIKNLKQLKVMLISWSPIRRLPASIGMLERLEVLHAEGCELAGELPTEIGKLSSLSILNVSRSHICAVPTTINSLTRLQKLDLANCNDLQELPKLPSSLNCLLVGSTSLRLVSDLSNLTNLVELHLSNWSRQALAQASNPMQTLQLQWVGKLSKLEKLTLCLLDVLVPSTELNCLPGLKELTLYGMDNFDSVVVGPQFDNFKNLSSLCLYRSPLREIQLDGLELLRDLAVRECEFLEGLSIISSSLRKLYRMDVASCPKLLEIQFLSTMESLEKLRVEVCNSLGELCGLSNSKKLKTLSILGCDGLRVVEGLEELELLRFLSIRRCGSLEWLTDESNSKIPNECRIDVWDCGELPDTNLWGISYGEYRERILERRRKTFKETSERKRKRCSVKPAEKKLARHPDKRKRRKREKLSGVVDSNPPRNRINSELQRQEYDRVSSRNLRRLVFGFTRMMRWRRIRKIKKRKRTALIVP